MLINGVGKHYYGLTYQYREIILYIARVDLKNKNLLEIGGNLPNELLFDQLQVEYYTNIESHNDINAREEGKAISEKLEDHPKKQTIMCDAED